MRANQIVKWPERGQRRGFMSKHLKTFENSTETYENYTKTIHKLYRNYTETDKN
jgi:hypothetical protein